MDIKYCSQCGGSVSLATPAGDSHSRHICDQCGYVHYQNPKVVTGCLVYQGDKVLLCKRAIEPRLGMWTVPAGFMENGESTRDAAKRETMEESGAIVAMQDLFLVANLPHANQVYMLYLAELKDTGPHGPETSETQLFNKDDLPWDEVGFYTVKYGLMRFFEDLDKGKFSLHEIDF
ncbi:NUDIX hydrolase [Hahella sp. CR1]|uniref:NUDIX hydrolase n=1 Tax=Hahella sp. CR1 TaxID=2992807 RepID=UPI00325FE8CD